MTVSIQTYTHTAYTRAHTHKERYTCIRGVLSVWVCSHKQKNIAHTQRWSERDKNVVVAAVAIAAEKGQSVVRQMVWLCVRACACVGENDSEASYICYMHTNTYERTEARALKNINTSKSSNSHIQTHAHTQQTLGTFELKCSAGYKGMEKKSAG